MDSDDTIEPEMLSALYEKAKEGDFDWVMCDVRIRYVEEGREVEVPPIPGKRWTWRTTSPTAITSPTA